MILKDKRVLVVGAAGLLGREIVKSIIGEGGKVIAADISRASLLPLKDSFPSDCLDVLEVDITSKSSVFAAIEYCVSMFGGIDGAVNTAYPRNKSYGRKVFDVSYDDFVDNVGMHLGGYFVFMQQCARFAKESNLPFSLVNMSSIYGVIAPKFEVYADTLMTMPVEYAGIKSGLLHLNKYFTNYMKGTFFRANSVSPGGLLAEQNQFFIESYNLNCVSKGMLNPSDVTGAIVFLLSDSSRYVVGQNLIVDDGFTQ